jgi:hypothetical protein
MGESRKLHNEELSDLYCSTNIFRAIKSRRMRWAETVARMGERGGVYMVFGEETLGKEITWKAPGVNGRILLRYSGSRMWGNGLDRAGSGMR